ncbi:MAG: peptidase U34 [Asgard group archaeon]|nr:peptidase U34 [Asgard group archaeon]
MCDSLVALGNSTKNGNVIFAKNSDRQPDEPAEILHIPRKKFPKGSEVKTTYIEIPQIRETYEILLCKPIWIWGAEMGTNEFGLTIANEAVFTKEKYHKKGRLIGMDLVRLALERAKTASEALEIIIDLLEIYGQGGDCGYRKKEYYHNVFLIADKKSAWILETANKYWIAKQVKDIGTVSNTITIRGKGDLRHPELIEHAVEKGWCKDPDKFDFYNHYRDKYKIEQIFAFGMSRCNYSAHLLRENKGNIDQMLMMNVLRSHRPIKQDWVPVKDSSFHSICIHARNIFTPSQTTISMVSELSEKIQTHWITGTSAPCTSIFKPFFMPSNPIDELKKPKRIFSEENLWWKHELLHRLVLQDYMNRLNAYRFERDELENQFIKNTEELLIKINQQIELQEDINKIKKQLTEFTKEIITKSLNKTDEWIKKIKDMTIEKRVNLNYRRNWNKLNKLDKMPSEARF